MKCPVCGMQWSEKEMLCPKCGWIFAEDAGVHSILFGNMQMKFYEALVTACRDELHIESADLKAEISECDSGSEFQSEEREQELRIADFYPRIKHGRNLADIMWRELKLLEYEYEMGETALTGDDALIHVICEYIATHAGNSDCIGGGLFRFGELDYMQVGDYFYLTLSNREKVKFVIAGFGIDLTKVRPEFAGKMKGYVNADGKTIDRYAFIVPENCFSKMEPMQKTGFLGLPDHLITRYEESHIYNNVLPQYTKMLQKKFGSHLVHQEGKPELELLNHEFLYGNMEMKYEGLPLFVQFPDMREAAVGFNGKEKHPYWLKDEGRKGFLSNEGKDVLPYKKLGVRPVFRIG